MAQLPHTGAKGGKVSLCHNAATNLAQEEVEHKLFQRQPAVGAWPDHGLVQISWTMYWIWSEQIGAL